MALLMQKRAVLVQVDRSRDRMVVCARASANRRVILTVPILLPLLNAAGARAGDANFKQFLGKQMYRSNGAADVGSHVSVCLGDHMPHAPT
jgi:hypothetical protein